MEDPDRTDSDDNSFMGILGRLGSVGNILITASSRLDAISAVMGVPPSDDRPALDAALGNITLQCAMSRFRGRRPSSRRDNASGEAAKDTATR